MFLILFPLYFLAAFSVRQVLPNKLTYVLVEAQVLTLDNYNLDDFLGYLFTKSNLDFVDYIFQAFILNKFFLLPLGASIVIINCFWASISISYCLSSLRFPPKLAFNLQSIYMVMPLSLLGILPFSFRDSYILSLCLLSISSFSRIQLKSAKYFDLFILFSSQFLLFRARSEFVALFAFSFIICILFSRHSFLSSLVSLQLKLRKSLVAFLRNLTLYFPSFYRFNRRFFITIFSSIIILSALLPISTKFILSRLIVSSSTSYVDLLYEFQSNRLSRGVSYGSGSDVVTQDEFNKYSLEQRILLQFFNNVITPLRFFPISLPKAFALLDSISYILVWSFFFSKINKSITKNHSFSSSPAENIFFVWSIVSLLAFSLIISNGGNAFRYKTYWALPLTISLFVAYRTTKSSSLPTTHAYPNPPSFD